MWAEGRVLSDEVAFRHERRWSSLGPQASVLTLEHSKDFRLAIEEAMLYAEELQRSGKERDHIALLNTAVYAYRFELSMMKQYASIADFNIRSAQILGRVYGALPHEDIVSRDLV